MEFDIKKCGVYCIRNIVNGKCYIGSTVIPIKKRWSDHKKCLKRGIHCNKHLQKAYIKYGENAFVWEVIENTSKELARIRESHWIKCYNATNPKFGYNIAEVDIDGNTVVAEETKKKLSDKIKQLWKEGVYDTVDKSGMVAWNKGLKCDNISKTRRSQFTTIEVYKNKEPIAIFRSATDLSEWSETNELPGLTYSIDKAHRPTKGRYTTKLLAPNIHRAIRENKIYRGLTFKKGTAPTPEMGVVQWVNCGNSEILNPQPSTPLTKCEGSETNS